jgi:dolichol-phosphate mannosyltransferase
MKNLLTVVIPIYNESENIFPLYDRLSKVLDEVANKYQLKSEILFVNDGSTDSSIDNIRLLHERDQRVKLLSFSRNFGHQIAITAGLDYSDGSLVVVMDGDLQHPPELIPQLIEQWQAGYEIVYTIRQDTAKASIAKRLTSRLFYKLLQFMSPVAIPEGSADFRLMDRKTVEALNRLREKDRFLRGLIPWIGFRQIGVPYSADKRYAGRSKYSTGKMLRLAADGILSFSIIPLRLSFFLGLVVSLFAFLYALYALVVFATGRAMPGWTSILIAVLVLGGIQLIVLGIVGEYIGRIYQEVKNRPIYIIRETLGLEDKKWGSYS